MGRCAHSFFPGLHLPEDLDHPLLDPALPDRPPTPGRCTRRERPRLNRLLTLSPAFPRIATLPASSRSRQIRAVSGRTSPGRQPAPAPKKAEHPSTLPGADSGRLCVRPRCGCACMCPAAAGATHRVPLALTHPDWHPARTARIQEIHEHSSPQLVAATGLRPCAVAGLREEW